MAVNKIPESQLPLRSVSESDSVRVVGADGKSYRVPKTDFNGGGGGGTVDPSLSPTSTNAVQNKAIYSALSGLKDDLGDLSELETTNKSSLVEAINEVAESGGGGGGSVTELYEATYGTTTNAQIETAINAGKVPYVVYNDRFYFLTQRVSATNHRFMVLGDNTYKGYSCVLNSDNWTNGNVTLYQKPSGGIPKSDLASTVQTTLDKADTAVQPSAITNMQTQTITDAGGYFSTDTVEGALQELGSSLDGVAAILAAL